jgi:hypothetical protein
VVGVKLCQMALCPRQEDRNRFSLEVTDLTGMMDSLRDAGVHFRSDLIPGVGGKQALIDDPSGNPVELFEPTRAEARLSDQ